jgi:hypothetical protein
MRAYGRTIKGKKSIPHNILGIVHVTTGWQRKLGEVTAVT